MRKRSPDRAFWNGKRVFLTGHTGFKGGWLALWLRQLGAIVHGYALAPPTVPNLFTLARLNRRSLIRSATFEMLKPPGRGSCIPAGQPDIMLHLAAQPIPAPLLRRTRRDL